MGFCGFSEESTVEEIREAFENNKLGEGKGIQDYRPADDGLKGAFDAAVAIILGGTQETTPCGKKYIETVKFKQQTWYSQATKSTVGKATKENKKSDIFSKLVQNIIKENDTLKEVYKKLESWDGWDSIDKRQKVLAFLKDNDSSKTVAEQIVREKIEENKQIIFTGAPGTGKTYSVREYIKQVSNNENQSRFVQFHPSYDYSDFVEGLRPVNLLNSQEPTFVRLDGTFKEFCRSVVEENLKDAFGNEAWSKFSVDDKYKNMEELYKNLKNKSEEDKNKEENTDKPEYKISHNGKKFFFVVDEINRADLSKVFGELMFGLEESYRGLSNRFDTQYKNLCTYRIIDENDVKNKKSVNGTTITNANVGQAIPLEFDCFKNGFFIPENLYFIGTMNDIDRSVDSMDFALRRRFMWVDIKANEVMIETLKNMNKEIQDEDIQKIGKRIIAMNNVITSEAYKKFGLSEAYHIGPAYFKKLKEKSLQEIFNHNIVSILKEYTRGRKEDDIKELLKDCAKKLGVDYNG